MDDRKITVSSRYFGLVFNVSNAIVFAMPRPSYQLCRMYLHWLDFGRSFQVLTMHSMLVLRLYAMYEACYKVSVVLLLLIIGDIVVMGVIFGKHSPNIIATNEVSFGNFICGEADPPNGNQWYLYFWAAVFVVDGVLLLLGLWKALRRARHNNLLKLLVKDAIWYFIVIFAAYLINLMFWSRNEISLVEIGTPFFSALSTIAANRLLVNIRAEYYYSIAAAEDSDSLPIRFTRTQGRRGSHELDGGTSTFHERLGI